MEQLKRFIERYRYQIILVLVALLILGIALR